MVMLRRSLKMANLNIGTVSLGDHDSDWLKAMAQATGSSMRSKVTSALSYYVRTHKEEYKIIIEYTARKHGLTFSDCFHRLRSNQDLGSPVSNFDIDYEIEEMIENLKKE